MRKELLALAGLGFAAVIGTGMGSTALAQPANGVSAQAATATVVVAPTPVIPPTVYQPGGAGGFAFANASFERLWSRTDRPVRDGLVQRTWFWGPGPNTPGLTEQYQEDPSGRGQRLVQYFDKSRMELNNPGGNPTDPFYVTNGLLTVDMIAGSLQVGEKEFTKYHSACIPMSGDFGDSLAPTYFAFQKVSVSGDRVDTHPATDKTGQKVTETIDRNGTTGTDASKANIPNVNIVHYEVQTKHNIPRVFWDFLNSQGQVRADNGQLVTQQLINPWFFASGLPISEAYWSKAKIRGVVTDVLIQAYERRALTYVPTNQQGFQVEMANIGQHYFDWRYRNAGLCAGQPAGTPTAPVPAGTPGTPGTAVASRTVTGTPATTSTATGTPGTTTPTVNVPPGTVVPAKSPTSTPTPTGTLPVPSMVPGQ